MPVLLHSFLAESLIFDPVYQLQFTTFLNATASVNTKYTAINTRQEKMQR
jgi:hypothetical protein